MLDHRKSTLFIHYNADSDSTYGQNTICYIFDQNVYVYAMPNYNMENNISKWSVQILICKTNSNPYFADFVGDLKTYISDILFQKKFNFDNIFPTVCALNRENIFSDLFLPHHDHRCSWGRETFANFMIWLAIHKIRRTYEMKDRSFFSSKSDYLKILIKR